jgi:phytoene dehydrogenase-like protein
MASEGHHVLEISTICPYQPFKQVNETDSKAYKQKKRHVYHKLMESVQDLVPDIDNYIRMKVFGTPTTTEYYLGQPQGNIYGTKLIPKQVGLNRLGAKCDRGIQRHTDTLDQAPPDNRAVVGDYNAIGEVTETELRLIVPLIH